MYAVIYGGPRDGETIPVPDGAIVYRFLVPPVPEKFDRNVYNVYSPFGATVEYVTWNICQKRNHETRKPYYVIVEPRFEKWLRFWMDGTKP